MTTENNFEINDNVTCVNSAPLKGNDVAPPLTEGSAYQVLDIHTCGCGKKHFCRGSRDRCKITTTSFFLFLKVFNTE